jgi:hypothetical protein
VRVWRATEINKYIDQKVTNETDENVKSYILSKKVDKGNKLLLTIPADIFIYSMSVLHYNSSTADTKVFESVAAPVIFDISYAASYPYLFMSPEAYYKSIKSQYFKDSKKEEEYGKWFKYYLNKELVKGMPDWIVKDILGSPDNTDKSYTASGVKVEEWYYERYDSSKDLFITYLTVYFEDGKLVRWKGKYN